MRRLAELGFFGAIVNTGSQTAFFCGFPCNLGLDLFFSFFSFGVCRVCDKVDIEKMECKEWI